MKKIFLTGSSSYLGSRFVVLYSEKYDICGLSRDDTQNPCDLNNFYDVKQRFDDFQPDLIIHLAADLGRDIKTNNSIVKTNPQTTQNLINLAKSKNIPFIFTSTEAVYGGKENEGCYIESDQKKPRSLYGESKALSEKVVLKSDLPYLITRSHRYVGMNTNYHKPKQFLDTMKSLINEETVHLDSEKIFTPAHIDNICDIINHYIDHYLIEKIIVNIGCDKPTTYFDFILDIAKELNIDKSLICPDGNEQGWPQNSSLCMDKLKELKFPYIAYDKMIDQIVADYKSILK